MEGASAESKGHSHWLAGAAEIDITPPLGLEMTGYAGRPSPADRVLDPLHARALAVSTRGGKPMVLTGGDLLGITARMVRDIRMAVADVVPAERLLLNHSHTHAGPNTGQLRAMGRYETAYLDRVVAGTAAAVRQAVRAMEPASLAFGAAETRIGLNRRELREGRIVLGEYPAGAYDNRVSVLRVDDSAGRPLACWFSHGTHPVVMDNQNTGISAEWPGAAAADLKRVLGCPAVFAQGCCGDINPVRRGDHSVVRSVGRELAGSALIAWERAVPLEAGVVAAALETVRLPLRVPSISEAEAAFAEVEPRCNAIVDQSVAEGWDEREKRRRGFPALGLLEWGYDYLYAARTGAAPPVEMDVQAIRLGDLALVGTAAETFTEIGLEIERRSPFARTVALGYTNGCFGYLPTAAAFPRGGYEVDTAFKYYGTFMVTPECEALTLEAAERVLTAVRGQ